MTMDDPPAPQLEFEMTFYSPPGKRVTRVSKRNLDETKTTGQVEIVEEHKKRRVTRSSNNDVEIIDIDSSSLPGLPSKQVDIRTRNEIDESDFALNNENATSSSLLIIADVNQSYAIPSEFSAQQDISQSAILIDDKPSDLNNKQTINIGDETVASDQLSTSMPLSSSVVKSQVPSSALGQQQQRGGSRKTRKISTDDFKIFLDQNPNRLSGVVVSLVRADASLLIVASKSNYIKAGFLSHIYKGVNIEKSSQDGKIGDPLPNEYTNTSKILPFPAYCTGFVMGKRKDFLLPFDIHCLGEVKSSNAYEDWKTEEEQKEVSTGLSRRKLVPVKRTRPLQNFTKSQSCKYKKITKNCYTDCKPIVANGEELMCSCEDGKDRKKCGPKCLNRIIFSECPAECGENCQNRRISNREVAPNLQRFMTGNKGFGVKTNQNIMEGDFILEYVGEVVTNAVFKTRMLTTYANDFHHYCLDLGAGYFIDGHRMGGECRFVNHSCEPNCEMQKWSVNGVSRMALFAKKNIDAGEELSYDYNFTLYNPQEGQACHCDSENCRGVIGERLTKKNVDEAKNSSPGPLNWLSTKQNSILKRKMKILPKKTKFNIKSGKIFVIRNYEKIRLYHQVPEEVKPTRPTSSSSFKATTMSQGVTVNDLTEKTDVRQQEAEIFYDAVTDAMDLQREGQDQVMEVDDAEQQKKLVKGMKLNTIMENLLSIKNFQATPENLLEDCSKEIKLME